MGRTESIFAGILLAAVILAVLVVVLKNDTRSITAGEPFATAEATIGSPGVRFTGNASKDLCTCYEQAYAYGARAGENDISSDIYRGGFQACATRLGPDGGDAWTWGWSNGMNGPGTPKTCNGYAAQMRALQRN